MDSNEESELDALPLFEYAVPGPLRERLCGLTLAGAKTTTFDLVDLLRAFGESPPEVGQRSVMVSSAGTRLALMETVAVETMRLADVPWELADAEGESFVDVEDWRRGHEQFWEQFVPEIRERLESPTWTLTDNTEVLCEHVRVVQRLDAIDVVRFPVVECVVNVDDVEWASAELIELETTGIEEVEGSSTTMTTNGRSVVSGMVLLRAGFGSDEAAVAAEAALARRWLPRFEVLLGQDWLDAWREHFEPQTIGRFTIVGDWDGATGTLTTDPEQLVMKLDPARAFGTGAHPSTKLILEAIQRLDVRNATVLDVGCGSGVLSIAALMLGAASAHGTDVERAALDVTLDNARRNGVADRCTVAMAWAPSVDQTTMPTYDIVITNILAPVLRELAPLIRASLRDNGTLLLAGLIDDQVESVRNAYADLELVRISSDDRWRCIELRSR